MYVCFAGLGTLAAVLQVFYCGGLPDNPKDGSGSRVVYKLRRAVVFNRGVRTVHCRWGVGAGGVDPWASSSLGIISDTDSAVPCVVFLVGDFFPPFVYTNLCNLRPV